MTSYRWFQYEREHLLRFKEPVVPEVLSLNRTFWRVLSYHKEEGWVRWNLISTWKQNAHQCKSVLIGRSCVSKNERSPIYGSLPNVYTRLRWAAGFGSFCSPFRKPYRSKNSESLIYPRQCRIISKPFWRHSSGISRTQEAVNSARYTRRWRPRTELRELRAKYWCNWSLLSLESRREMGYIFVLQYTQNRRMMMIIKAWHFCAARETFRKDSLICALHSEHIITRFCIRIHILCRFVTWTRDFGKLWQSSQRSSM